MITCPYCGSSYTTFQTNCKNCGAPLPSLAEQAAKVRVREKDKPPPAPPPPPRVFSDTYVYRLLIAEGYALGFLAVFLIGTMLLVTGLVGTNMTFIVLSLMIQMVSAAGILWRYQKARQTLLVLRSGQATLGRIRSLEKTVTNQVNSRSTWVIYYKCIANSKQVSGKLRTTHTPGAHLQTGKQVWVLYLPEKTEINTLYPHP